MGTWGIKYREILYFYGSEKQAQVSNKRDG